MASGSPSPSGSDDITVLSWNINGLKAKLQEEDRKTALLEIIDKYDVVLLQETHIDKKKDAKDDAKNWEMITEALSDKYALVKLEDLTCRERADNQEEEKKEEEKKKKKEEEEEEKKKKETMYLTYFSLYSKGVAILVNKPHTLLSSFSECGDYAWVHVEIDGQEYTFVSVYYHHDYPHLIDNLRSKISTERLDVSKCRLVIGGDFNTTLDPELDATEPISDHTERRERVKEFLRVVRLADVWREKHPVRTEEHPGERQYTHTPTQSRIDYVFMLEDDVEYVTSCEILKKIPLSDHDHDLALSDHSPVRLTLNY